MTTQQFQILYPDITPESAPGVSRAERVGFSAASAVLAFGGAYGDLIVLGGGLVLLLFAILVIANKPPRRVRNEARNRFPGQDWAEYRMTQRVPVGLLTPLVWTVIALTAVAVLYFVPHEWAAWAAAGVAVFAAVAVWFMPGLSPVWSREGKIDSGASTQEGPENATEGGAIAPTPLFDRRSL